jgi:hypothetical protein
MLKRKQPEIDICATLRQNVEKALLKITGSIPNLNEIVSFSAWVRALALLGPSFSFHKEFMGYDGFYCLHMSMELINYCAPVLLPLLKETEVGIPMSVVSSSGHFKHYPVFFGGPCTLISEERNLKISDTFKLAQKRVNGEGTRWAAFTLQGEESSLEILSIRPVAIRDLLISLAFTLDPHLSKRSNWYESRNPKRHSLEIVSVPGSDTVYDFILLLSKIIFTFQTMESSDTDKIRKIKRSLQLILSDYVFEPGLSASTKIDVQWRPMPMIYAWAGHVPFRLRQNIDSTTSLYLIKNNITIDSNLIRKSFHGECFYAWNTKQSESGTSIDGPDLISYNTNTDILLNSDAIAFLGIKDTKLPVITPELPSVPSHHLLKNEKSRQIYDQTFHKLKSDMKLITTIKKKCLDLLYRRLSKDQISEFESVDWFPGQLRTNPIDPKHARMLGVEEINGVWYCDWIKIFLGDWHNVSFTTELCVLKSGWSRHGEVVKDQIQLLHLPLNWEKQSVWEATLCEQANAFMKIATL